MSLRFSKMHGLGNDFVIVDCRDAPLALDIAAIRRLGDRHFGVGFDQLLTIERATAADCAFAYGVWNTDGSRARQCGNGVRCIDLLAPAAIPLLVEEEHDPYRIDVAGREVEVGAVSMGNPHALVEVDDVDTAPVESLGAQIEHADAFPDGCNVGFAEVRSRTAIGPAPGPPPPCGPEKVLCGL